MNKLRNFINKPFIIALSIVVIAIIIVTTCVLFRRGFSGKGKSPAAYVLNDTELSNEDTEELSTTSAEETDTSDDTSTSEELSTASPDTSTEAPSTKAEYTTVPIEEISTTHDNSRKDEVMGGTVKYESPDGDDSYEDPLPTPIITTPAATTAATTTATTPETAGESSSETPTEVPTAAGSFKYSEHPIKKPADFILDVTYGIDVSKWQGVIDWKAVKEYGVDFAMIKLGGRTIDDGTIYMDSTFEYNIQNALLNNIKVGIYFFSQAINVDEVIEEASYVIANLKGYNITYPVYFDFEQGSSASNPLRRTWLAMQDGTLTRETLTEMACAFCNTIESAGYESGIYASRNSWRSQRWDGQFLNDTYRTWLAVYYSPESGMLPNFGTGNTATGSFKDKHFFYFPTFNINGRQGAFQTWQYYDRGRVDGIGGNVDLDMCFYIHRKYQGYVCPLKVTIKNKVYNTVIDNDVDILAEVSATNVVLDPRPVAGDYGEVNVKITNALGAEFSREDAIKNRGKYTIEYSLSDFTGCTRYNYAILNVYGSMEEMLEAERNPETTESDTSEADTSEADTTNADTSAADTSAADTSNTDDTSEDDISS